MIQDAMTAIENTTCIRFVPKTTHRDYIRISNGTGCYSRLGRVGGVQSLSLSTNYCFDKVGRAIHELIHALGETLADFFIKNF
jgi:Astacin (Peptidase family M12A)